MSTIKAANIQNPSAASAAIVLDTSGNFSVPAGTVSAPGIQAPSDSNTGIFFPAADTIAFAEGGAEAMRIDSSSRLLVGTSSAPTGTNSQYSKHVIQGNTFDGSGSARMAMRVGVGASSLSSGSGIADIYFVDSGAGEYARIGCEADAQAGTNDYPGRLIFSTTADGASSPTERARITNLGALKVSTSANYSSAVVNSAVHELRSNQANRTVWVSNTNNDPYGLYVKYEGYDPNGTSNEFLVCDGNGTVRASIRSNGGLANFSANNANLSDRNVKKDITPAAGTWDCIKEWEIVNYRYKDQPDDADLNLGVIAQQVAESCPEVITVFSEATEDEPEKLGVKEQQMYWMAIKALQEAQVRIEALEAEVAALKAQ